MGSHAKEESFLASVIGVEGSIDHGNSLNIMGVPRARARARQKIEERKRGEKRGGIDGEERSALCVGGPWP